MDNIFQTLYYPPIHNIMNIEDTLNTYYTLRERRKLLDNKLQELSKEIKKIAKATGKNINDSYISEYNGWVYGSIAKHYYMIDIDKLRDKLIELELLDCLKIDTVIDLEKLQDKLKVGDITYELNDTLSCEVKHAVYVDRKANKKDNYSDGRNFEEVLDDYLQKKKSNSTRR